MTYLRKYLEVGMNMTEIEASIVQCYPVMRWNAAARERIAGYLGEGKTPAEIAELEGVELRAMQSAIYKYEIAAPEKPPEPVILAPPPRPSAYRLAEFDPVIRRACEKYEQSRRAA